MDKKSERYKKNVRDTIETILLATIITYGVTKCNNYVTHAISSATKNNQSSYVYILNSSQYVTWTIRNK